MKRELNQTDIPGRGVYLKNKIKLGPKRVTAMWPRDVVWIRDFNKLLYGHRRMPELDLASPTRLVPLPSVICLSHRRN